MRNLLLFGTLLFTILGYGQDQLGISNSNYAGTDAVSFAPGRVVYQWQATDIKLLGTGVNVWNNYVFLGSRQRTAFGELSVGVSGQTSNAQFDRNYRNNLKKGSVFTQLEGPAAVIGFGKNAIGAHITSKAQLSVSGITNETGNFIWEGLNYQPQHNQVYDQPNLRLSYNAYTEFGGTFSRQLYAKGNSLVSAGVTAKYLIGHLAGGFLLEDLNYIVLNDSSLTINEANGEYGFVEPSFAAGKGMGFDVGVHYQRSIEKVDAYVPHKAPYGCEPMPYHYRLSLSLLDVGSIKYADATTGVFDAAVGNIANYNSLTAEEASDVDSLLRNTLNGVNGQSEFRMGLATAIAAQADFRLTNLFYVSVNAVQPIGGRSHMRIRRNAYAAVTPRLEHERWEAAVPIIFREYQKPVFGFALRLNSIVIGSDDIFPWLSKSSNIYGADVYAKLKITLFRKAACRDRKPKAKADVAVNDKASMPCVLPD